MAADDKFNRRSVISALGGAVLALGFDPALRRFVGRSDVSAASGGCADLPALDGVLLLEPPPEFARDAGYHLTRSPWAVLFPGSIDDIVRMVGYCRCHGIPIGPRGQGHTRTDNPWSKRA